MQNSVPNDAPFNPIACRVEVKVRIVRLFRARLSRILPPDSDPLVSPIQMPPSRIPIPRQNRGPAQPPVPAMIFVAAGLELIGTDPRLCDSTPPALAAARSLAAGSVVPDSPSSGLTAGTGGAGSPIATAGRCGLSATPTGAGSRSCDGNARRECG